MSEVCGTEATKVASQPGRSQAEEILESDQSTMRIDKRAASK